MKFIETLRPVIQALPHAPGVYQYLDEHQTVIYVGKAKDLKKRVSSYFTPSALLHHKTRLLVSKIRSIRSFVVDTEVDALLLENNLIKKYQPQYNILLKDDKHFYWVCVKKEPFPRVFFTRRVIKDGSAYFGPYPNPKIMFMILDLIKELFPRRTCNLPLTTARIESRKFSACLEYQIGNCSAPCIGQQSEAEYDQMIEQIILILKGRLSLIVTHLNTLKQKYVDALEFEKAQEVKEKLQLLESFRGRSTIVSASLSNLDVFTALEVDQTAYINFLRIYEGRIVQTYTFEFKNNLEEPLEQLLLSAIAEVWSRWGKTKEELILETPIAFDFKPLKVNIPEIGDKKKLVELSKKNVENYIREQRETQRLIDPERHSKRILETLQKDLRMHEIPFHIECFDNSNFQGAYPVSSMVCFKNAKPSKKDYRHFSVKTVEGIDDFASMKEVVYRRYRGVLEAREPLPQLIVIDGGKGQLGAALEALDALELRGKVTIISIAKRLEELFFPNDPVPLYLDKRSESLKLIQSLRNEAHRFAITYHRDKRSKGTFKTELTAIKGIGAALAEKLLIHFGSIERIKQAHTEDLEAVIGRSKTLVLKAYFDGDSNA